MPRSALSLAQKPHVSYVSATLVHLLQVGTGTSRALQCIPLPFSQACDAHASLAKQQVQRCETIPSATHEARPAMASTLGRRHCSCTTERLRGCPRTCRHLLLSSSLKLPCLSLSLGLCEPVASTAGVLEASLEVAVLALFAFRLPFSRVGYPAFDWRAPEVHPSSAILLALCKCCSAAPKFVEKPSSSGSWEC